MMSGCVRTRFFVRSRLAIARRLRVAHRRKPPRTARPVPRDAATAAAIERALAGAHRSAANRARDVYRHPLDTLLFFGIKPDMTVVEAWPGAGGWYTEVLAPLLTRSRQVVSPRRCRPAPGNEYVTPGLKAVRRQARGAPRSVRQGDSHLARARRRRRSRHPAAPTWS